MKQVKMLWLLVFFYYTLPAQNAADTRMNTFVTNLMKRMTLEEKIGQLNLLTPGGGIATGAVVSKDVESKISIAYHVF